MAVGNIGTLSVILSAKVQKLLTGMKLSEDGLRKVEQSMRNVSATAMKMSAGLTIAGAGAAFFAGRFEKQMTRSAAIAAGTAKNFDSAFSSMSAAALQMAGRTEFTAQQVGEGMEKLAMAGYDATKTIAAMPAVLQLSSAASLDLAQAADIVTNVMAGYGQGMDKLKSTNNTLVATFTGANVSLQEIGESMKVAGPVANQLNVSIEDTAAAIGLLGNAGIKGSDAGTGLKRAFSSLANVTPKSEKAFKKLGVSINDLVDPNKGIREIIRQLEITGKGFELASREAEFTGLIFEAFGERAGPKMAALLEQGSAEFDKLRAKIEDAKSQDLAGFLEEKQLSTFTGQLNILRSAFEQMVIAIGQKLIPVMKPLVKTLQDIFTNIANLNSETIDSIVNTGKWVAGISAVVGITASITATILGLTAAFAGLASAVGMSGGALALLAAGPAAAFIGAFAVAAATLAVYEMATGTTISVIDELKNSLTFASESAHNFRRTMVNVFKALAQGAMDMMTLGAIKLFESDELFTDEDKKDAEQRLDAVTLGAIKAQDAIDEVKAELARSDYLSLGDDGTVSVVEGRVGVAAFKDDSIWPIGMVEAQEEALQLTRKLTQAEAELATSKKELADRNRENREEAQRLANEEKQAADAKQAADDKLKAEAEEVRKKIEKQAEATAKFKRLLESMRDLQRDAARDLTLAGMDQGTKQIQMEVFGFEDKIAKLEEGLNAGAISQMDAALASSQLAEKLRITAVDVLKSKRGTAEFGSTLTFVAGLFDKLGVSTSELVDVIKGVGEQASGRTGISLDPLLQSEVVDAAIAEEKAKSKQAQSTEQLSAHLENYIAKQLDAITTVEDFERELQAVRDAAEDLGITFGNVEDNLDKTKERTKKKIEASVGPSLQEALSEGIFGKMGVTGLPVGEMKGMSDLLGGELASAIGGGGIGVGSIVGGALGAAIGAAGGPIGIAAGSAIGSAIESVAGQIGNAVVGAFNSIANAIGYAASGVFDVAAKIVPEERFSSAASSAREIMSAVAPVAAFAVVAAVALPFVGPLLLFLASAAMSAGLALVSFAPLLVALGVVVAAVAISLAAFLLPLLAIASVFVFLGALASKTKAFEDLMLGFEGSIDRVVESLEPLARELVPLLGLFDAFMDVMISFVSAMEGSIKPLAALLFNVMKALLVVFSVLALAGAILGNTILEVVATIATAVANFVSRFDATLANSLHAFSATARGMMVDTDGMAQAIRALANIQLEEARMRGQRLIDAKKEEEEISESMLNVPEGFKIALERFRATTGATGPARTDGGILDGGDSALGHVGTYIENVTITGLDEPTFEAIGRAARREAAAQAGNPYTSNYFNRDGR